MSVNSFVVFKEKSYLSYYDEKYFYAWLESIDGVEKVKGIDAGNLRVDLTGPFLSRTGAFDLIALFTRYSYPLSPIRDHISPEDMAYFKRPDARWFEALFGAGGSDVRPTPTEP